MSVKVLHLTPGFVRRVSASRSFNEKPEYVKIGIDPFRFVTGFYEETGMPNLIGDVSLIAYAADFGSCGRLLNLCSA